MLYELKTPILLSKLSIFLLPSIHQNNKKLVANRSKPDQPNYKKIIWSGFGLFAYQNEVKVKSSKQIKPRSVDFKQNPLIWICFVAYQIELLSTQNSYHKTCLSETCGKQVRPRSAEFKQKPLIWIYSVYSTKRFSKHKIVSTSIH